MKIKLDRLGEEPYDWQETLPPRADEVHEEVAQFGAVTCRGQLTRTSPGFLLQLSLRYDQTLRCMRCLRSWAEPVASEAHMLVVERSEPSAAERELEEQDLGVLFVDQPLLDTEPLLYEQLQLNVPMKPLCREDCAGLCGSCGADLNAGKCNCEATIDPRWAALAARKK